MDHESAKKSSKTCKGSPGILSKAAGLFLLIISLVINFSCDSRKKYEIKQEDKDAVLAKALIHAFEGNDIPGYEILKTYDEIVFRDVGIDHLRELIVSRSGLLIDFLTLDEINSLAMASGSFLYLWAECCEVNETRHELEAVVGTSWAVSPDDATIKLSGGMLILSYTLENGEWCLVNAHVITA